MSFYARRVIRVPTKRTLIVTVQKLSSSSARVTWSSNISPNGGWTVGRDGTDSSGYGPWSTNVSASTFTQDFTNLSSDKTYTFTVAGGGIVASKTLDMTSGTGTTPPQDLTSTIFDNGGGSVVLQWTTSANPPEGWTVGRDGTDGSGYGAWSTTTASSLRQFTFTNLVAGQTYHLTVSGGGLSSTSTITIQADPLTNFTSTSVTTTSISLGWSYSGAALTNYTLKRGGTTIATIPASSTSYTDNGLTAGMAYNYQLIGNLAAGGQTNSVATSARTSSGGAVGTMGAAAARLFGSNRSGLPWLSGCYYSYNGWSNAQVAFEQMRGAPLDAVMTYCPRDTWANAASQSWPANNFNGSPPHPAGIRPVVGVALNVQEANFNYASAASGARNYVYSAIATHFKNAGFVDPIFRLGWELEGSWFPHQVRIGQENNYKAAFRQAVNSIRAVLPNAKFCHELNGATIWDSSQPKAMLSDRCYPGDDVVDLVGVDWYNAWEMGASNEAEFQAHLRPPQGIGPGDCVDFARAHNKGVCFNEWGLAALINVTYANGQQGNNNGRGDSPWWINRMYQFMWDSRDVMALELYFDDPATGNVENSFMTGQMPNGKAAYQACVGPSSPYRL